MVVNVLSTYNYNILIFFCFRIMNETAIETDTEECIICMERKPEVTLPCAHAYCLFCIEQWYFFSIIVIFNFFMRVH